MTEPTLEQQLALLPENIPADAATKQECIDSRGKSYFRLAGASGNAWRAQLEAHLRNCLEYLAEMTAERLRLIQEREQALPAYRRDRPDELLKALTVNAGTIARRRALIEAIRELLGGVQATMWG